MVHKYSVLLALIVLILFPLVAMGSEIGGDLYTGLDTGNQGYVMAQPVANPGSGTYTSTQSVTLSATGASAICYTVDGSNPSCTAVGSSCATGNLYTGAISISQSTTLSTVSCYPNNNNSGLVSYSYAFGSQGGGGGGGSGGGAPASSMPETTNGQVAVAPSAGGKTSLTTSSGVKIAVEMPAGSLLFDSFLKITETAKGNIAVMAPTPDGKSVVSAFDITITVNGQPVTSFSQDIIITITYTNPEIQGVNESTLKVYRWNGSEWVALPSTVNKTAKTVTATTRNFSYFALIGTPTTPTTPTDPVDPAETVDPSVPPAQMTVNQLRTEITRLTAILAQLQQQIAILRGETPTIPTMSVIPAACQGITFTRNLSQQAIGEDVKCLQAILNQSTDTQVAASGVGSPGQETSYFGALTKTAVIRFQEKYRAEVLTPLGLTSGTGFVGRATITKLNQLLGR